MASLSCHIFNKLSQHNDRDSHRRTSNRFQLLADMPDNDLDGAAVDAPKKRSSRTAPRSQARRKYAKRSALVNHENVAEAIEIAHSQIPLASRNGSSATHVLNSLGDEDYYESWQETIVASYDPHLEVMLPGDLTLDNLPRPVPAFTVRTKTKSTKRERPAVVDDDDWDLVSNASDESFCMV